MRFGYWAIRFIAKVFFLVLFRNKVYGAKKPYAGGAMIAPNHTSFFDPPIVAASWPGEVHFLASEYLFKVPIFSGLIRFLNSHPVNRGQADLGSIKVVCKVLGEGAKVVVFPEGRRSEDGTLQPVKHGIGLICSRSGAAVVPTYIHGTFEAWGRGRKFPKLWGRTAVVFGTPILWEEFAGLEKKEAQEQVAARVGKAIEELRKWYLAGAKGVVP